ncbi:uncharacterized protein CDV56_106004 [Aspergillus thermomutatus]|uniref:Uncharacterized protein n=1 Tax=Aspergillus thermomutatus TaxID=41047 RepID=A0A397GGH3_ASPTH|nr:uncharacterized protein CDV56_106004 [Aspergillus thermomutatus]RHZ48758.1 hypothetical protein CDV56_106004 [Aspergillus thermomutatus]
MYAPQRKSIYTGLTVKEAISKLLTDLETIELRGSLKPHEIRRAENAVRLIHEELPQPEVSKADKRREKYRTFLKKVKEDSGMVVAIPCGIILRQTIIGCMTEYHRLRLPSEIKKHERHFKTSFFQGLVQEYAGPQTNILQQSSDAEDINGVETDDSELAVSVPVLDVPTTKQVQRGTENTSDTHGGTSPEAQHRSLSGRVFALTHEDARAVVMSNQISGAVWMTDPYDNASLSFITIPISDEVALYFSDQRRRVM